MRRFDLILFSLIIFAIIMMGYIGYKLTDERNKCIASPLIYGAKQLKQSNGAEFSCTCGLEKPGSPTIRFNSNNMSIVLQNGGLGTMPVKDINFSKYFN